MKVLKTSVLTPYFGSDLLMFLFEILHVLLSNISQDTTTFYGHCKDVCTWQKGLNTFKTYSKFCLGTCLINANEWKKSELNLEV